MFKAANPYDEIVVKATDENLTSENWQLNLDVCDKVSGDGESGARNCVAAILKRLVHRNANVQLYALTLSDALAKNCGLTAHRELASRSYCQTLQRISLDRNTHATVKRKCIELIKGWSDEWGADESLGLVRETMEALKTQGVSFRDAERKEDATEAAPVEPSSEQLRAEDEELRRVLELSLHDQGGRNAYENATASGESSSRVGAASAATSTSSSAATYPATTAPSGSGSSMPVYSGAAVQSSPAPAPSSSASTVQPQPSATSSSRVRALFDFVPTEEGELAFQKGDVIRVLDSVYDHWWRGELRGEAGIFPVNYVELLPDPTPADIQREAELEARIFAQANDIDRLLGKLRGLDPARDNLAEDEELQELYQASLTMRPKIVKLIDRYNLKVNELRSMNDKFVRARATYDAMMEQTLSKYQTGTNAGGAPGPYYNQQQHAPSAAAAPYQTPESNGAYHHPYGSGAQQVPPQQQYAGGPPPASDHAQAQQQDEHAQSWANWYAQQQGYAAHPAQPATTPGAAAGGPPLVGGGQQPSFSDQEAYSQWYYSQQQQQQQQGPQQSGHQPQYAGGEQQHAGTAGVA